MDNCNLLNYDFQTKPSKSIPQTIMATQIQRYSNQITKQKSKSKMLINTIKAQ